MKSCCLCTNQANEDGAILTMSGFGNPRLLCPSCEAEIEKAKFGREVSEIEDAMHSLANKLSMCDAYDTPVIDATNLILLSANERLEKIKAGEYDFALDDVSEEEYEIPEDMLESEEDKELDRIDEEKGKRLDFVTNIIFGVIIGAVVLYTLITLIF